MRVFLAAGVLLCASSLVFACSKSGEEAPAEEPPADVAASPEEGAEPAEADDDAAAPEAEAAAEPAALDDGLEPPPALRGELDEPTCKKVCGHATALTMQTLPPEASAEMKAEVEQALRTTCPRDCRRLGTEEMASCIMDARTALDLASCQG